MNKDKISQNRFISFEIILNFALTQKDEYCTGSCNFGVLSIMLNLLKQKMRSRSRAQKNAAPFAATQFILRIRKNDDQGIRFYQKYTPVG